MEDQSHKDIHDVIHYGLWEHQRLMSVNFRSEVSDCLNISRRS